MILFYKFVVFLILSLNNFLIIMPVFWLFVLSIIGDNGRIEYSITAGDDNNDFEIVQNGTIYTKRMLDRETKNTYNLVVTAKDCAKEPEKRLSSTVQVRRTEKIYILYMLKMYVYF